MKKNITSLALLTVFACLALSSCQSNKSASNSEITQDDFLWQWIDSTVKPGDDFFKFATGIWMKNNPIPASERRWGIANLVRDDNYTKLRNLGEEAAANKSAAKGSNAQKIGDFWATGMDSVKTEEQGISPLQPQLDKINNIKTKQDLLNVLAEFQVYAGSPLFSQGVMQDEKHSDRYAMHFYQGGIGLPERDYYFNTDERTKNIRKEYVEHVTRMLMLLGENGMTANRGSAAIMNLETELAKASRKLEDLRDPYANYNKMSVADFSKLTPSINWNDFMVKMNISNVDSVIVGQPEFYKQVEKSLQTVSIDNWKEYLRWNLAHDFAPYLSSKFVNENFEFYGKVMVGVKTLRPRWKRVLDEEENDLGDALGQLYVGKYVPASMRVRYTMLTQNMLESYKDHIQHLEWMGDSTKVKALEKLGKITSKVCFPDKWKDYSKIKINKSQYFQNLVACSKNEYNFQVSKVGKPVDRFVSSIGA